MQVKHADNYNVIVFEDNGNEHLMFANQLQDHNLHFWQGWSCHAGYDYVYVSDNGDVWAGQCQNEYLGNLNSADPVKLLQSPTICKRSSCSSCTTDLSVQKNPPEARSK
jgi:hypothetical protein